MSTADAVTREAAWLSRSGDGLPALLSEAGGPWDVINGYWPRTPSYRINGIYVLRSRLQDIRISNQRKRPAHQFRLKLIWVVGSTTTAVGVAGTEQLAFDTAVGLLLSPIRGALRDKTHRGGFLSVGGKTGPQSGKSLG